MAWWTLPLLAFLACILTFLYLYLFHRSTLSLFSSDAVLFIRRAVSRIGSPVHHFDAYRKGLAYGKLGHGQRIGVGDDVREGEVRGKDDLLQEGVQGDVGSRSKKKEEGQTISEEEAVFPTPKGLMGKPSSPKKKASVFLKKKEDSSTGDASSPGPSGSSSEGTSPKGITIRDFNDFIHSLEDDDLKKILQYLKNYNETFIDKLVTHQRFSTREELFTFLREELINFLNAEYEDVKSTISSLRRKGKDVSEVSLQLMAVPLKIKIFSASFSERDFYFVLKLLDAIHQRLPEQDAPPKTLPVKDNSEQEPSKN